MGKAGSAGMLGGVVSIVAAGLAGAGGAGAAGLRAAGAEAARGLPARTLVGLTSQAPCRHDDSVTCGSVNVVMGRGLRSVRRVTLGWEAVCAQPGMYSSGFTLAPHPALKRTRRSATFSASGQVQDDFGDGVTGVADERIAGKLTRRGRVARGTFRSVERVYRDGQLIDTCDTGSVSWTARTVR